MSQTYSVSKVDEHGLLKERSSEVNAFVINVPTSGNYLCIARLLTHNFTNWSRATIEFSARKGTVIALSPSRMWCILEEG